MLLPQDSGSFLPSVLASPTLQVEGFCRLEGNQTGTFTNQGHRLPAWLKGPCGVRMYLTEGCRGGRELPASALLGMAPDSICSAMGFPCWCLRLDPTSGDVVNMWGHPSSVALELN